MLPYTLHFRNFIVLHSVFRPFKNIVIQMSQHGLLKKYFYPSILFLLSLLHSIYLLVYLCISISYLNHYNFVISFDFQQRSFSTLVFPQKYLGSSFGISIYIFKSVCQVPLINLFMFLLRFHYVGRIELTELNIQCPSCSQRLGRLKAPTFQ